MFESFKPHPADPIFSLTPIFERDPRAEKVNLSIGMYTNAAGEFPLLSAVKAAAEEINRASSPSTYLPMAGHADYRRAVQILLFGPDQHKRQAGQVSTIQSLGGTGALRIGADILKRHFPQSGVWVSDPTWDNHKAILRAAGLTIYRYPYFDPTTNSVDFEALFDCLAGLPPHSIVLFHACCHNPTGADLSPEQWDQIGGIARMRKLIPFFDFAYQGFAKGIDEDAYPIRMMAKLGLSFLVANSFSKNFGLYGERCGALSFVCSNQREAALAQGEMESVVRSSYSNPPFHGAHIIAKVLLEPRLQALWRSNVEEMRLRIQDMRAALVGAVARKGASSSFNHLLGQQGMFGYTGLSAKMVEELREKFAVYLVDTGRLCFAGLNFANVEHVADALAQVIMAQGNKAWIPTT